MNSCIWKITFKIYVLLLLANVCSSKWIMFPQMYWHQAFVRFKKQSGKEAVDHFDTSVQIRHLMCHRVIKIPLWCSGPVFVSAPLLVSSQNRRNVFSFRMFNILSPVYHDVGLVWSRSHSFLYFGRKDRMDTIRFEMWFIVPITHWAKPAISDIPDHQSGGGHL